MLLCDCDEFTKEYYSATYGVEDFTPVQLEEVAQCRDCQSTQYNSRACNSRRTW